jgi:glycosyltransferase involved in cell wall biosynthesis
VIVSDDASTDDTPQVAAAAGARVVYSGRRNIGATRNVGAATARGRYLLFLDADTRVNPATFAALKRVMNHGVTGGGALIGWSEPVTGSGAWVLHAWNVISRLFSLPAGGFFFVRRDAFAAVGGFDEQYYVSEELHLAHKLKRLGRLVILRHPVATSPRKLNDYSTADFLGICVRAILSPLAFARDRSGLEMWYEHR